MSNDERVLPVHGTAEEPTPEVRIIDARPTMLAGEASLRERARTTSANADAPFTSRSYRFPFALVAWHTSAVGVDIERIEPCDQAFADSIRTPAERARGWPRDDPDRFFTSLWSSKEALSKALGNALDYDPRRLEGPGGWPDGCAGRWRAATLEVGVGYVGWLCWRAGAFAG